MAKFIASKLVRNENINGVIIKGGHGLTGTGLILSDSLVMRDYAPITSLSDSEYDLVKDHFAFKKHLANGVLLVVDSNSESAAYAALKDMTDRTESSVQLNSGELESLSDEQSNSTGVAIVLSESDEMQTQSQIENALAEKTKKMKAQ